MKKVILKVTFAVALAVVTGITAYNAQNKEILFDWTLDNVEALAQTEVIRCVSVTGGTLFYCRPDLMRSCYCDGLRPGRGYYQTYH